ncbi:hypothetical protein DXV65_23845 [Pseudomonas fluorescens]|nr:hypothetical protein DXV65_23845 [Pseudomonas fluorescens]
MGHRGGGRAYHLPQSEGEEWFAGRDIDCADHGCGPGLNPEACRDPNAGAGLPAIGLTRSNWQTELILSQASQLPHKPAPTQASSHTSPALRLGWGVA